MATINAWGSAKPAQESFGGTNQSTYTTGDILYASAANTLSKLPVGSTGNVLQVSAGVPAWGTVPGGTSPWVLLQHQTAANSANISFGSSVITATYNVYAIVLDNVVPVGSDRLDIHLSSNNGSTYVTSGYNSNTVSTGTGVVAITTGFIAQPVQNSTGGFTAGFTVIYLNNLSQNSTTAWPGCNGTGTITTAGPGNTYPYMTAGLLVTQAVYNNFQFKYTASNINYGDFYL